MKANHKLVLIASGILFFMYVTSCSNKPASSAVNELKLTSGNKTEGVNPADTLNKPELVQPGADGALKLTAQNGNATGPEIKYMPEWRAFGWFTAADQIEWDVDVPIKGEYEAILEWSVSDEEAGKEFLLQAKDQKLTGIIGRSGSWETFKTEKVGSIQLEAGRQKIVFKPNRHFDKGAILDFRELKLKLMK